MTTDTLDRNKLTAELFEKHKIAVSEDDPVFTALLINQTILEKQLQQINEGVKKILSDYQTGLNENIGKTFDSKMEQSTKLAEDIVNKSLNEVVKVIEETKASMRKESNSLIGSIYQAGGNANSWGILLGVANLVVTLGLLIYLTVLQ